MDMPQYAKNAIQNQGQGGGGFGDLFGSGFGGSLAKLFGGLFGNSGGPYDDAMKEFQKYMQQAMQGYQPYQQAGQDSINPFQKRLGEMSDPSAFYKQMMSGYNESPLAQNQQRSAMQASTNAASANGLAGSTPMQQAMQQNARDISSQDQEKYFGNLNGINNNYMSGLKGLMGQGMNAQGGISDLLSKLAEQMGGGAYGKAQGNNQDFSDILSGLFGGLFGNR